MNGVLGQLGEWTHFALALIVLVIGGISTVGWFFYRRDVRRTDTDIAENKTKIDDHERRLSSHDRQIRDTRTSDAQIRGKLEMDAFPYTE